MGLLPLFVVALAASAALAADSCQCVNKDQTIDPIKNPMIFFQNPTVDGTMNGNVCSTNCDFTAKMDVDDPKFSLQVQILTNNLKGGSLVIGGLDKSVTITSNDAPAIIQAYSYGDSITIQFTEPDGNDGTFMLVVQKVNVAQRPSQPSTVTTTAAPPTPPYNSDKFKHNPLLVANDIMLAFDLSSEYLDKYKDFATALIKELTINPKSVDPTIKEDCGVGSRLSLVGLSALAGFDNLYAPYWTTSLEQAVGNIGSLVRISTGDYYIGPINDKYLYGFDKKANGDGTEEYTSCENRGKIFILLTSSKPNEFDPANPPLPIDFLGAGVHQIIVNYNAEADDLKYYDNYNKSDSYDNAWNYFKLGGVDADVENFMNNYLVSSSQEMTCQPNTLSLPVGNKTQQVFIPPYYDGRKGESGETKITWDKKQHYCNYQDTTIDLKADDKADVEQPVCLKVFYDLETGKDFISIFSGDFNKRDEQVEVVRLTGRDVSGTNFELPGPVGSIVFSSDEKNVYDGFYAEITKGHCS